MWMKGQTASEKTLFVKVPAYIFYISKTTVLKKKEKKKLSVTTPQSCPFVFIIIDAIWQTEKNASFLAAIPLLDWNRHFFYFCVQERSSCSCHRGWWQPCSCVTISSSHERQCLPSENNPTFSPFSHRRGREIKWNNRKGKKSIPFNSGHSTFSRHPSIWFVCFLCRPIYKHLRTRNRQLMLPAPR